MAKFRRAESGMTLAEHLAELRHRFLVMAITITVFGALGFIFYPNLLKILQDPYCAAVPGHCKFLVTNPLDGLTLRVKIAFFGGFLVSLPVILWQVWRFITPGLKAKERRYIVPFVTASIVFFSAGVVVAYFIFGVTFLFPVVLLALELVNIVTPAQLLRSWRYTVIAVTVASAVFTPSGDPLSMLALAIPLVVFYFLAIGVGKLLGK